MKQAKMKRLVPYVWMCDDDLMDWCLLLLLMRLIPFHSGNIGTVDETDYPDT